MELTMPAGLAQAYKSPVQKARVVSEGWGHDNLYCPHCPAPVLISSPPNTQAVDYVCPRCGLPFQLKSQSSPLGNRIVDAGYEAMMRAIREDRTPNLFVLHYARDYWEVRNVILVPHFIFSASAVEKRKPLAATARRAGWVGCNIVLRNIPLEARINLVRDGNVESPARVRDQYRRLEPLKEIGVQQRGWTLDVLHLVQSLGKREFTNAEVYAFERRLEELHPDNRHIRDKIRQQLQVLRDRGFLVQVERGVWAMK